jgi:hypothetical protein
MRKRLTFERKIIILKLCDSLDFPHATAMFGTWFALICGVLGAMSWGLRSQDERAFNDA